MKNIAIILAAGSGSRANSTTPKQFMMLGVRSILDWSVSYFCNDTRFCNVIIVHANGAFEQVNSAITQNSKIIFTEGGATRTHSVQAALLVAQNLKADRVFIHDAARPGINKSIIDDIFREFETGADGALPILHVADALWQIEANGFLTKPVPREDLRRVQTPQAFDFAKLMNAYSQIESGKSFNDDAEVAVNGGMKIGSVTGDFRLDKITFQEDFERMENILLDRKIKVGSGFDAHKFGAGDFVTLCGEKIPHSQGLLGHSDADVAWHALVDAILGALGEGDIGNAFPPSEPQWKGAPSSLFLEYAVNRVKERGGSINHLDITIICEEPKIGPVREKLIANTCRIANLDSQSVSIKATTTEKMGFTGRKEGIAAQAIATIKV